MCDVPRFKEFVYRLGQPANEKINPELLKEIVVQRFAERLASFEAVSCCVYCGLCAAHGKKEFLEVEGEHLFYRYAANGHRCRLRQCYSQLRTTGDISVSGLLIQELQHCHKMRVALNLVEKDQRVAFCPELVAGNGTKLEVEVGSAPYCGEYAQTFLVLL